MAEFEAGDEVTDEALVSRVLEGRTEDYRMLVERHKDAVFRFAWVLTRDRDVAEEVVQRAFVAAYGALARYEAGRDFRKWMFGIAVRETRRMRRSELRRRLREAAAVTEAVAEDPAELFERGATAARVWQAIGRLPPVYREVVVLRYLEDRSLAEVAEILGQKESTVRTWMDRARKELRRMLGGEEVVG